MKPTVAIIGIGLIGGSLGQALRKSRRYRVIGIARKAKTLREATRRGAIDIGSRDLRDAAAAEIIIFAGPVDAIIPLLKRLLPSIKPGTLLSDVGSVKGTIVPAASRLARTRGAHFVGGHPLAGSHKTGVEASNSRLFEGSTVVLVPAGSAPLAPLKSLWRAVGARSMVMSAPDHDRAVALISHLPHALAHTLVHLLVGQRDRRRLIPLLAGSFRNATRVAAADSDQWAQILRANAAPVRAAIGAFRRELSRLEKALGSPRLKSHLRRSQNFRRPLFNGI